MKQELYPKTHIMAPDRSLSGAIIYSQGSILFGSILNADFTFLRLQILQLSLIIIKRDIKTIMKS